MLSLSTRAHTSTTKEAYMQPNQGMLIQDARMFEDSLYRGPVLSAGVGVPPPDDFNKMFPGLPAVAPCTKPHIIKVRELSGSILRAGYSA